MNAKEGSQEQETPSALRAAPKAPDFLQARSPLRHALRALRHKDFRRYFFGQLVSFTGGWMQTSALFWLVHEMTRDERFLGYTAFASGIASFAVAPFAGVLLDRFPRRKAVFYTQALLCLQSALLAIFVALGWLSLAWIIVLSLFSGIVNGADMPARHSLVGEMAPPEDLPSALALNASTFNVARVVGNALGGLVIAWFGALASFSINTASFFVILLALTQMKVGDRPYEKSQESALSLFRLGLRYVRETPLTRALLPLIMLASFGGSYFQLLPALAKDHLALDAGGYGLLGGSAGFGSIVGAFAVARMQSKVSGARVLWGASLFGLGLLLVGLSPFPWLSYLSMVVVGFGMTSMYTCANSLLQTNTPQELKGRIMSLYVSAFAGASPLGALLLGWLASYAGPASAIASGGLLLIVSALAFRWTALSKESS